MDEEEEDEGRERVHGSPSIVIHWKLGGRERWRRETARERRREMRGMCYFLALLCTTK